jgi:hypothetical protein
MTWCTGEVRGNPLVAVASCQGTDIFLSRDAGGTSASTPHIMARAEAPPMSQFPSGLMSYQSAFAPTGIRVIFRAPPPANPARIPVNASVAQYHTAPSIA